MKKFAVLAVLSIFSLATSGNAQSCHKAIHIVKTTQLVKPISILAVFQPVPQIGAHRIMAFMLGTAQRGLNEQCPFVQGVKDWKAWKQRNPNAHSRYDKSISRLSYDDMTDPEPDPALYGPCGCDLAFALSTPDGCGWFHSQVGSWSLHN